MLDVLRLVKEVEAIKKPRKLVRNNKAVAGIMPTTSSITPKKKQPKTKVDYGDIILRNSNPLACFSALPLLLLYKTLRLWVSLQVGRNTLCIAAQSNWRCDI
jgi:hypothetical protein